MLEISGHSAKPGLKPAEQASALWIEAEPDLLPLACMACMQAGGAFDSAFAYPSIKSSDWTAAYVFRVPSLGKPAVLFAHAKKFHSVSGEIPAAVWDERKMHEMSGLEFAGLADTRPIVIHPESAKYVSNRAHGPHAPVYAPLSRHGEYKFAGTSEEGEFEIPVGPVHAGIIEPGHFRFHVTGETINKMEVRLSYLHLGIEDFAYGRPMGGLFPLIEQISGDESVANSAAYAQAVESLAKIRVPREAESLRLVLLEMERIYSHLADLGGMAMDVGYYASSSRFTALREDMMRLNMEVTGSRFLRNQIAIGGLNHPLSAGTLLHIRARLKFFSKSLAETEAITLSSSTFLDRVYSTGRLSPQAVARLAVVGPVARASGFACDARRHLPYGAYKTTAVHESMAEGGDVFARFTVKMGEVKESVRLIEHELANNLDGPVMAEKHDLSKVPSGLMGLGWSEAPRGSCMFLVRSGKRGTVDRLAVRTPSYRNWAAIQEAVLGNITADFPLINKSFNL